MDISKFFVEPSSVENRYNQTSTSKQFPAPEHSGFVPNIRDVCKAVPYSMYKEAPPLFPTDYRKELVGYRHTSTPLNTIFFSQTNLDKIQDDIRDQVKLMSGGKYTIDRQSDDSLMIIMRSYYAMFAKNDPRNVAGELEGLNKRVVGYASAKVYSEVDFHEFYLNDIQDFAAPIANPMNVSVYGTRTSELKSFF